MLTKHSVNLDCLGYGSSVSGIPKAEIQDSAFFFLWLSLPFHNPKSYFPSSLFHKWLLPFLLAYTSLHPSLSVIPLHTWWIYGWVRIRKRCMCTSPSEKDSQDIDLPQGWISAFQQQTPNIPEGNRNWFSPFLGAILPNTQFSILPKTFHQGLTNAGEFVNKY